MPAMTKMLEPPKNLDFFCFFTTIYTPKSKEFIMAEENKTTENTDVGRIVQMISKANIYSEPATY